MQQVLVSHRDIIKVILLLQNQAIFMASASIFHITSTSKKKPRLISSLKFIQEMYVKIKKSTFNLDLVLSGAFNRCDTLWNRNLLESHLQQEKEEAIVKF